MNEATTNAAPASEAASPVVDAAGAGVSTGPAAGAAAGSGAVAVPDRAADAGKPVVEGAAAAPVVEKKPERISPKLSALARKDREQMQRDRDLKAREQAIADRETAFKGAKEDPIAWAERELGLTYDAYTERILKGGKPEPKDPAKLAVEKVEELQKTLAERDRAAEEAKQQAAFDAEISRFRAGVAETIAKDDAFELCRLMGNDAVDLAQEIVSQHATKTSTLMPLAEALRMVEAHYEELASTLTKAKKLAPKAAPEPAKSAPAAAKAPSPTISSRVAPTTDTTSKPSSFNDLYRTKYKGQIAKK